MISRHAAGVSVPDTDPQEMQTADHELRRPHGRIGAVAHTAVGIFAPTIRQRVGGNGTRVTVSGAHGKIGVATRNLRRHQTERSAPWTETPAIELVVNTDAARVAEGGRYLRKAHRARNRSGNIPRLLRTVAELAVNVVAPAIRRVVHRDGARVVIAGADLDELV